MFGKKKKLLAAVRSNDVDGAKKYFMDGKNCYDACKEAMEHNAPDAMMVLLEKNALFFSRDYHQNCARINSLLDLLEEKNAPDSLFVSMYKANDRTFYSLPKKDFMRKTMPLDVLHVALEKSPGVFGTCVKDIGLADTEKLAFILSFTPKDGGAQVILDNALITVAERGDMEKAKLLLQHRADPNYAGGKSRARAAQNGYDEMVALLSAPVDPENAADSPDAVAAQKDMRKTTAQAAEGYMRLDDHTLADVQTLPNGRTLTTLFNFTTEQQHLIVTDAEGHTQRPVVVDLTEKQLSTLREKFDALAPEQTAANENTRKKPELASQGITKRLNSAGL